MHNLYLCLCPTAAGADFVAVNSTISFSPTEQEACTTVEIIDDDIPNEPPEQFLLEFTLSPLLPLPPVSVTILDNDVAGEPLLLASLLFRD